MSDKNNQALTEAQIAAGAEILCDCPKPKRIGRNVAISVFDALICTVGAADKAERPDYTKFATLDEYKAAMTKWAESMDAAQPAQACSAQEATAWSAAARTFLQDLLHDSEAGAALLTTGGYDMTPKYHARIDKLRELLAAQATGAEGAQTEQRTPNPFPEGSPNENWRRGYEGVRHFGAPDSEAAKHWKMGRAARRADDAVNSRAAPTESAAAPDDDLNFTPDAFHAVSDMANVGYDLMQRIKELRPGYCWNESPAEIVGDLINELDEAKEAESAAAPADPILQACAAWPSDCPWSDVNQELYDSLAKNPSYKVRAVVLATHQPASQAEGK